MKTKNFNLEMFRNGAKAQTKLGNPVKFISITNDGKLFVSVKPRWKSPESAKYNLDGRKYTGANTVYDLEMVDEYEI